MLHHLPDDLKAQGLAEVPFGAPRQGAPTIAQFSAGWRYIRLFALQAGAERGGRGATTGGGEDDGAFAMVEGKASFRAVGRDWGMLGERSAPASRSRHRTASTCRTEPTEPQEQKGAKVVIAVCSAPGQGRPGRNVNGPDGITLTERGKGANTRHINNIAMENEDFCRTR